MFALLIISFISALAGGGQAGHGAAVVDQVNPLIGTAAEGQTFPATGVPFGMTQWTPQTRDGEGKCVAPYYFSDTRIQGFRGSHFMSGSCTQDYGSVTLMPMTGALKLGAVVRSSLFAHDREQTTPYSYAVHLEDYGIDARVTGTSHAGLLRFEFDRGGRSWVVIEDNSRRSEGTLTIDREHGEIYGANPVHRLYAGSGKPAGFSGYFVIRFDHSIARSGTWSGSTAHPGRRRQTGVDGPPGAYVGFDLNPGETVQVKVGMSFTSIEEARRNLDAEIPDWDYQRVEDEARAKWERALEKVQIGGGLGGQAGAANRRIFYTALYHSMLLPREFSDVSGTYPGFAGEGRIEVAKGFTYYDDYSLWDTFRAVHPLFTILDPNRELDMVKSLISKGQQGGFLPIYPAWNSYTSEMIGDHADAVIADAYVKGIRGFDVQEAYRLMR